MCVHTYVRSFVCSPFVIALATSFIIQFRYNFTQSFGYDYTSNKFAFQHDRVKVKVAVTVFRKTLQLKACQASKGKNLTSSFIFITKGDNKIYG